MTSLWEPIENKSIPGGLMYSSSIIDSSITPLESQQRIDRGHHTIPRMSSVKPLKEVVQRLGDTFNDPKIRESSYFNFYDDSLIIHGFSPNLPANKEGFKQFLYLLWKAFPDIKITFEDIIVEENKVVGRYNLAGTHRGEFANLQPTEKQFRVDGMTIFSFRDTKVVERWNLVNMMSLMEQLRT